MLMTRLQILLDAGGRGTQKKLADYLNESRVNVNRWASGARPVPLDQVAKIAMFFGVSTDYLLVPQSLGLVARHVPVVGVASCGVPSNGFLQEHADEFTEYIPYSGEGKKLYALRAVGDSMETYISDGDTVIFDAGVQPVDGEIVHYTLTPDDSGIKIFKIKRNGMAELRPLNPAYMPIELTEFDTPHFSTFVTVQRAKRKFI